MAQTTLRDYLQETEDAISSGRIEDAFTRCQHILAHFPESLEAQRLLGEVYLRQDKLDDAQHAFDWVLTNDPENIIAYCDRALISERRSDYETALDCYQQAYELSRGSSQIRNEFNKLSARIGQQGFMFSRAGLARLYMRGDLLTQSVQEWEAVLASGPDRLDARIGLLEVYWREGDYKRVEQLATQVLQEIPGCVKSLLLLAHVVSSRDVQRAQELLRQAEALDPDLMLAQEIFEDMFAARSPDPFLSLLKKSPTILEILDAPVASAPMVDIPAPSQDLLYPAAVQSSQEVSDLFTQLSSQTDQAADLSGVQSQEQQLEPWQLWHEAQVGRSEDLDNIWGESREAPLEPITNDLTPSSSGDVSSPPAWLSMLTQQERMQLSGSVPTVHPEEKKSTAENPVVASPKASNAVPATPAQKEDSASILSLPLSLDDDDGSMFGPAWLKSLGATAMESETVTEKSALEEPAYQSPYETPVAYQAPAPHDVSASYVPELPEQEQDVIATLEELEKDLFAQGFVALEPNTLSSVARSKTAEPVEVPYQQSPVVESYQDAALSSVLAELADTSQAQPAPPAAEPEWFAAASQAQPAPAAAEPEWLAALRSTSTPAASEEKIVGSVYSPAQEPQVVPLEQTIQAASRQGPVFDPMTPLEQTIQAASRQGPVFDPVTPPPASLSAPTAPLADPFFSGELETTMRRPAVRLQHIQSRPVSSQRSNSIPASKERKVAKVAATSNNSQLSYQERLVKGYQYQLAGDYDEAMQEYRLIVKGAPELLGEVVSNVRALLKLAPKYAAGYRVLGDAYMRQGEYLQAMESYNKALTIAKKTKD